MRLEKCWFCSSTVYPGHGICFIRNDSKTFKFCRTKCHKNFKMKRNPRKVKWTKVYRALRGKDLSNDTIFEFERRRNRPIKYNRELVHATLNALEKLETIRTRRNDRFFGKKNNGTRHAAFSSERQLIEQNISLVRNPLNKKERTDDRETISVINSRKQQQQHQNKSP